MTLVLEDEHARWAAYRAVIASAAHQARDRALVVAILRDPVDLVTKSAIIELVDVIARQTTDPAWFRRLAADLAPELDGLAEEHRAFVRRRVEDWSLYLALEAGHAPTTTELHEATNLMQRLLAERSTSRAAPALLGELGRTKKTRDIAKNSRL